MNLREIKMMCMTRSSCSGCKYEQDGGCRIGNAPCFWNVDGMKGESAMKGFIEITDSKTKVTVLVNVKEIRMIAKSGNVCGIQMRNQLSADPLYPAESYETIKRMIQEAME